MREMTRQPGLPDHDKWPSGVGVRAQPPPGGAEKVPPPAGRGRRALPDLA